MPKKSRRPKSSAKPAGDVPTVTLCTPTHNRRPFLRLLKACVEAQDYPKPRLNWVIIDDGTDDISDLFEGEDWVSVRRLDAQVPIGHKRRMLVEAATGDIVVNMDDDDYYPPQRVSHAVATLRASRSAVIVGSSRMPTYFRRDDAMYALGPYGPTHATAATMAFWRKAAAEHRYDESACFAEETQFLNGYRAPVAQLDPSKTIVVMSHGTNTCDKEQLRNQGPFRALKDTLEDVIGEANAAAYRHAMVEMASYDHKPPSAHPKVRMQLHQRDVVANPARHIIDLQARVAELNGKVDGLGTALRSIQKMMSEALTAKVEISKPSVGDDEGTKLETSQDA